MTETASGAAPDQPRSPAPARIVHRTHGRLRLRVASRRHDLAFFVALYDSLRHEPEIDEITLNPATGSVLVWFDPSVADTIEAALTRGGALAIEAEPPHAPHQRMHAAVNNMRILVFLIMLALSVQQLRKGQWLTAALTMVLYVVDLAAGVRLERDAAAKAGQDNA